MTDRPHDPADPPQDDGPDTKDEKQDVKQDDDKPEDKGGEKPDDKKDDEPGEAPPKAVWPWVVAGLVVVVFIVVVLLIVFLPHSRVKTNDAYVTGHYATVAPRIGGQIASVTVDDNQTVAAGTLLATIDDRDLQTSLTQAEANLAADRARVAQARAQVARQPSQIRQAEAQLSSTRAHLALSSADAVRYADLASTGAGTFQQHEQADTSLAQDHASIESAQANVDAQRKQRVALEADVEAAVARIGLDEAQVRQARLNLSYTRITAPIAGTVGQRSVQVGNFVAPGAPILTIVPLDAVYIVANYREVDLRHMRPGQHVLIHVDAYDVDLDGVVDSLPPASGATFSPIPPNNATGNFTKIVQRLPVKIVVRDDQPLARLLRAGMSVETTVDTALDDVVDRQRRQDQRVTAP